MLKLWPFLLLFCSCTLVPGNLQSRHSADLETRNIRRIAIFPAEPLPLGEKSKTPYSAPASDAAREVEENAASVLNRLLYSTMSAISQWQVVSDREVREVMAMVPAGAESERAGKLGQLVYADAVIFPRILRYRERVGEDWGVKSPASVAFVLDLWDVKRGDRAWFGQFDETQRPLSENLLALGAFFRRGWGWVTAEELAFDGIKKAMDNLRQNLYDSGT